MSRLDIWEAVEVRVTGMTYIKYVYELHCSLTVVKKEYSHIDLHRRSDKLLVASCSPGMGLMLYFEVD